MSIITMQTVIAKLCVDFKFRESFLSDPDKTLEEFSLTREQVESIKAIDLEAINDYAGSLIGKRMGLIKKWLPLSVIVLETNLQSGRLNRILHRYGLEYIRDTDDLGGEWVRSEFKRFCNYLRELISLKQIDIRYFADVLEFEVVKFSMMMDADVSRSAIEFAESNGAAQIDFAETPLGELRPLLGAHARVRLFNYDMGELIEHLENFHATPGLEEEPTWVLFFKKAHSVKVDSSTINPPLKDLLDLCTGDRTVEEIVSAIASKYALALEVSEEDLRDDSLGILEQVYKAGAITFISEKRENA